MSTLQRAKDQGGWAMENIAIKCKTLLYYRLWLVKTRDGVITTLMRKWKLDDKIANLPDANVLPRALPYILQYAIDVAYIEPSGAYESMKAFKRRIYRVLLTMATNVDDTNNIQIIRKNPELPWQRICRTLHTAGLSDAIKPTWYAAIHDIIPTHERLAEINLVPNMTCSRCGEKDALHQL
jgi:hypothetical protein